MLDFEKLKEEYALISRELSLEGVHDDREKYQRLAKRFSFLEKILNLIKIREGYALAKDNLKLVISDSKEDEEVRKMAREEFPVIEAKIKSTGEEIEDRLFEETEPERDLIFEIRAGVGGEESALFTANLFNMYSRYIEKKGWNMELLSSSPTDIGGFKEIVFSVSGKGVYTHLKFESGTHRVQRVPATEASGRIHTSAVTVAVLIEPKEVELKIDPKDLRIDTYRASGAGGQHVNRTDSAVRITHLPTGTVVACQDERSQIKNRAKAMRVLKARILKKMQADETNKITQERRTQIGSGDRSEKIRTYNYPERRVTDHRVEFTIYRLEQFLEGDIDEMIKKLIQEERKKNYESKMLAK
jgi:peptide chain release factor 1